MGWTWGWTMRNKVKHFITILTILQKYKKNRKHAIWPTTSNLYLYRISLSDPNQSTIHYRMTPPRKYLEDLGGKNMQKLLKTRNQNESNIIKHNYPCDTSMILIVYPWGYYSVLGWGLIFCWERDYVHMDLERFGFWRSFADSVAIFCHIFWKYSIYTSK